MPRSDPLPGKTASSGNAAEPPATLAGGERSFLIERADERRLHFDLHLELDGVMKSWAVTQGPSLDPRDKRLAVRTEDRVLGDTGDGTTGNGGRARSALTWDAGCWSPRGDPHEGLKRGVLKFDLSGRRFNGGFALVRLPNKPKEKRENWLLVKERDGYARSAGSRDGRSVTGMVTGSSMPTAGAMPRASLLRMQRVEARARMPKFVAPQLAMLASAPPAGEDWVHEIKYDGYRVISAVAGDRCRIYTRSGLDWTDKFKPIALALERLHVDSALLDGEIVALDEQGISRFQRLQTALTDGSTPLTYFVFDLLELNGRDLRKEPLAERKEKLRALLQSPPAGIRYSDHVIGSGDKFMAEACRRGLEGIVSKRATAPYVSRRTAGWIKCKCSGNDEFVIGGYRLSTKKGRPFASLLLGEYNGNELHYRGRVGTGFDADNLEDLGARLAGLARKTSPFVDAGREIGRDARWVEPKLVAQIAYTEVTSDGRLRHPSFLGLREDKPAREVRGQEAESAEGADTASAVMGRDKARDDTLEGVKLTHPERVLFAEAGVTKDQLAHYLLAVSDHMLPHVKQRPLSLVRCPEGAREECFFQKHAIKGAPPALKSVPVREAGGKVAQYLMIDNRAGLVAVAQMSGLEIHVWGARAKSLERPDRMVFDLDPDASVPFSETREAARDVRKLLEAAGLASFALVTGGKGIHVVVPLDASQDWETVKGFAKGVAGRLAETEPERFTATMSKAKRKGRIFIDWLRNERGATAIAPYSPRAKPNASVALPVSWRELGRVERANAFTIATVLQRLKRRDEDPWQGYLAVRQRIGRDALRFFA